MITTLALVATIVAADSVPCQVARETDRLPFCITKTYIEGLAERSALNTRALVAGDSVARSVDAQAQLENLAYWNLERRRVSRHTCSTLRPLAIRADTGWQRRITQHCDVMERLAVHDSLAMQALLVDPEPSTAGGRAARDATIRQRGERIVDDERIVMGDFMFGLVEPDPDHPGKFRLAVSISDRDQLRALFAVEALNAGARNFYMTVRYITQIVLMSDLPVRPIQPAAPTSPPPARRRPRGHVP